MSDFRQAYSNLIRAVWEDDGVVKQIESDPGSLSKFGFTKIPKAVKVEKASGNASIAGYDDQMSGASGATATFYIPPKPSLGGAPEGDVELGGDACCCCCPCCTCT